MVTLDIVLAMDGRHNFIDRFEFGLRNLLDPDNPFVPWMLIIDLVLLGVHLAIVYWVYRDALLRYNRGAPWAVLAMLLPIAGWLFYLMYRSSSLVQLDRIEAELFDESEHEWTDYDTYKANQGSALFKELSSYIKRPEAEGYSPWVRLSRQRELKKQLTPKEKKARKEQQALERQEARKKRLERRAEARELRRLRKKEAKERTVMRGAHGFSFKLSEGRQKRLQRKLELVEKLKTMPREDDYLEGLIYEMRYAEALQAASDGLATAEEMNDQQGVITYQHYLERINRLLEPGQE